MPVELDLENYRSILEDLPAGFCLVDSERRIHLWSRGAEELTGYLSQEVIGHACPEARLMHCEAESGSMCDSGCPLWLAMRDGQGRSAKIYLLHRDGQRIPVRLGAVPVRGRDGAVVGATGCLNDLAVSPGGERVFGACELDPATRLPGRRALESRLLKELQCFAEFGIPFGVLLFALDGAGRLLEMEGRNGIDAVFYATGQTLLRNAQPGSMTGRWSDERFLVILPACGSVALREGAEHLQRIAGMAAAPWWGERLPATVSAVGTLVRAGDTPELLVKRAEAALESSLASGSSRISMA